MPPLSAKRLGQLGLACGLVPLAAALAHVALAGPVEVFALAVLAAFFTTALTVVVQAGRLHRRSHPLTPPHRAEPEPHDGPAPAAQRIEPT